MSLIRQSLKGVLFRKGGNCVQTTSSCPSSPRKLPVSGQNMSDLSVTGCCNLATQADNKFSRLGDQDFRKMCSYKVQDFSVTDPMMASIPQADTKAYTKDEARAFKELFPDIVRELTYDGPYKDVPTVNAHIAKCLQYNLMGGKMNRGMAVPISFKLLTHPSEHTEENMRLANILGWCIELMQAFFLVADDIMDGAETRRGKECWYKKNEIGMMAFNDAIILESCIYSILDRHLKDHKHYTTILNAFLQTTRHTTIGQSLDMLSQACKTDVRTVLIDQMNMKLYNNIVKHKTSFYSFHLPVQVAMFLAGIDDPELHRQALAVLLDTGKFFQVQDDYLDCFGDEEVTGKLGTDIQDGKCSWLIVVALQRATPKQKEELRKHYGSKDPEDIAKVKSIYEELKLQKLFLQYEEEVYNDILAAINRMSAGRSKQRLHPEVFLNFLNQIYKRNR